MIASSATTTSAFFDIQLSVELTGHIPYGGSGAYLRPSRTGTASHSGTAALAAAPAGALFASLVRAVTLAVLLSLAGVLVLTLLGTLLLQLLAYRYLRWARTPSVLTEEREEGFQPRVRGEQATATARSATPVERTDV